MHRFLFVVSLPWCCIITVALLVFSALGLAVGGVVLSFDEFFHKLAAPYVAVHAYWAWRMFRAYQKSGKGKWKIALTAVSAALVVGFHFTSLHDRIVHGVDVDHHEHYDCH